VKFYQNYCKISFVCSFPDDDACVLVEKYEPEDEDDDDGYFRTDESCRGKIASIWPICQFEGSSFEHPITISLRRLLESDQLIKILKFAQYELTSGMDLRTQANHMFLL
jgi:hypothetical protein